MMTPPHLPVITPAMEIEAHAKMAELKIHRSEPDAGWSAVLQAYTMGQRWFWMQEGQEVSTIAPVVGMPYTKSELCFIEYMERTSEH
jgi:hypothetical protein